jgi:hypothetical protein
VARAEVVADPAAAARLGLPDTVPLPVTVVLLAGGDDAVLGPVSVRTADPTLLELLPRVGEAFR